MGEKGHMGEGAYGRGRGGTLHAGKESACTPALCSEHSGRTQTAVTHDHHSDGTHVEGQMKRV